MQKVIPIHPVGAVAASDKGVGHFVKDDRHQKRDHLQEDKL